MRKRLPYFVLLLSLCIPTGFAQSVSTQENVNHPMINNKAMLTVGSTTFTVTLQNNATANAFKTMLPMTINMSELHNNEKYYDLPHALPTNATNPGTIQTGDLMLYGSTTLVLFYKTFSTPYRYTRIGHIDNPPELQSALGSGKIMLTFDMQE